MSHVPGSQLSDQRPRDGGPRSGCQPVPALRSRPRNVLHTHPEATRPSLPAVHNLLLLLHVAVRDQAIEHCSYRRAARLSRTSQNPPRVFHKSDSLSSSAEALGQWSYRHQPKRTHSFTGHSTSTTTIETILIMIPGDGPAQAQDSPPTEGTASRVERPNLDVRKSPERVVF